MSDSRAQPAAIATVHGRGEVGQDRRDDVRRVRVRAVVGDDVGDAPLSGDPGERHVGRHGAHVVDEVRASVQGRRRHHGLARIDADRHRRQGRPHGREDGEHAVHLDGRLDGVVSRTGRLPTDVDEVGALGDHPLGPRHRGGHEVDRSSRRRFAEQAVTAERIGRQVEDAHDVGATPEGQLRASDAQGCWGGDEPLAMRALASAAHAVGRSSSGRGDSPRSRARTWPTR